MGIEESANFKRISDRLTTSGIVSEAELARLEEERYDAVINLLPDDHDQAVPDEAAIVGGQGLDYVHIPVAFDAPTPADLARFSRSMDALADRRVHVHCAANYRATAFCGLWAEQRGLCTADQADALIRDVWDPADHEVWQTFIADARRRSTD